MYIFLKWGWSHYLEFFILALWQLISKCYDGQFLACVDQLRHLFVGVSDRLWDETSLFPEATDWLVDNLHWWINTWMKEYKAWCSSKYSISTISHKILLCIILNSRFAFQVKFLRQGAWMQSWNTLDVVQGNNRPGHKSILSIRLVALWQA